MDHQRQKCEHDPEGEHEAVECRVIHDKGDVGQFPTDADLCGLVRSTGESCLSGTIHVSVDLDIFEPALANSVSENEKVEVVRVVQVDQRVNKDDGDPGEDDLVDERVYSAIFRLRIPLTKFRFSISSLQISGTTMVFRQYAYRTNFPSINTMVSLSDSEISASVVDRCFSI